MNKHICIWHKSCWSASICPHAKPHKPNKKTETGNVCTTGEQCRAIGAVVKCIPENDDGVIVNKISKINIDIDAVSGEMIDMTFFFADNPNEPHGVSEFVQDSKTQNKMSKLMFAIERLLSKHKINNPEKQQ
jgi:hypothetical protein